MYSHGCKADIQMQVLFIYDTHTRRQAQPKENTREGTIQFDLTLTAKGGRAGGMEGWMVCKEQSDGLGQMPVADT